MAILKYESENELYHHGIKGQKWGVRRFQNRDGSVTPAGRRRYYGKASDTAKRAYGKAAEMHSNNRNKRIAAKAYAKDKFKKDKGFDKVLDVTYGMHHLKGASRAMSNTPEQNRKRAEKYLRDKEQHKVDKHNRKLAAKGYAQDQLDNEGRLGRAYDRITDAHKYAGQLRSNLATREQNAARAEKYLRDKERARGGRPDRLVINASDSAVTKRAKKDYNNLSDQEFMNKYQTSKSTYAKRADKYGDPYMDSPSAKLGKKLPSGKTKPSRQAIKEAKAKDKARQKEMQRQTEIKLRAKADSLFKKHPDLYELLGGPDQIDDWGLFELVLQEKGYKY